MSVIKVEHLSKQYKLGVISSQSFREDLQLRMWKYQNRAAQRFPFIPRKDIGEKEGSFWALRDVSFEVQQGEVLGIIGKNGAGKSTLLKILSKVTLPTSGQVKIKGRIASLLEVGTGFHPDLTGRENIFMNGAILGMSRREILSKFDEIVEFAGVSQFIDTPVKKYSSGMYVRLAFAVAAHLEPEILIIDEVLAVGDAEFQKKCLGKMKDVAGHGRTVLFVSHQMAAINQLCSVAMLIENGLLTKYGSSAEITALYLNKNQSGQGNDIYTCEDFDVNNIVLQRLEIINSAREKKNLFFHNEEIIIKSRVWVGKMEKESKISLAVLDKFSNRVFTALYDLDNISETGSHELEFIVPPDFIAPNQYSLHFALYHPTKRVIYDYYDEICHFKIIDAGSVFSLYEGNNYGSVFPQGEWRLLS